MINIKRGKIGFVIFLFYDFYAWMSSTDFVCGVGAIVLVKGYIWCAKRVFQNAACIVKMSCAEMRPAHIYECLQREKYTLSYTDRVNINLFRPALYLSGCPAYLVRSSLGVWPAYR